MAKNTIKLKKYVDVINEYKAVGAINPGALIEVTSAGKVQPHSTSGGTVLKMFALEDELQGRTIDTAFSADEPVQCWQTVAGEEVYAWLKNGQSVAIGDFLTSGGDGTLIKLVAASAAVTEFASSVVGIALEAVDMSGSDAVDPSGRIKIRIN